MSIKGNVKSSGTIKGNVFAPEVIYGASAYGIAVKNGFVGTEEEWLESLKIDGIDSSDTDITISKNLKAQTDKFWFEANENGLSWDNGAAWFWFGNWGDSPCSMMISTLGGGIDVDYDRIVHVGEPVNDSDAANKDYVDNSVEKAHKLAIPRKQFEGTMDPPQVIGIKENASLEEIDGKLYPNDTDYRYFAVDWVGLKDLTDSPAHKNVLAMRDGNGNLYTYEPVDDFDCVNKAYVDNLVGDIETLLGGI